MCLLVPDSLIGSHGPKLAVCLRHFLTELVEHGQSVIHLAFVGHDLSGSGFCHPSNALWSWVMRFIGLSMTHPKRSSFPAASIDSPLRMTLRRVSSLHSSTFCLASKACYRALACSTCCFAFSMGAIFSLAPYGCNGLS